MDWVKFVDFNNNYWIYDALLNQLLEVSKKDYCSLNDKAYLSFRSNHSIFANLNDSKKKLFPPLITQKDIQVDISVIVFEITDKCNLNCHYCYVPKGKTVISDKTISCALNFYSNFNVNNNMLSISFGSGEPLLYFDKIKQVVEKANNVLDKFPIKYSLTTNGLLMDEQKLKYFEMNKFSLALSLDGPKEVHDKNRVGIPSHDNIMRLINVINKEYHNLGSRLVYSFTLYDLESIEKLHKIAHWFNNDINEPLLFRGSFAATKEASTYYSIISESLYNKILNNEKHIFELSLFGRKLNAINSTFKSFKPSSRNSFGLCIPGGRNFIGANGNIYLCEKTLRKYYIGNTKNGYDLDKINSLYDIFYKKTRELRCNNCWAINFCSLCFAHILEYKPQICEMEREFSLSALKLIASLYLHSRKQHENFTDYLDALVTKNVDKRPSG